MLRGNSCCNVAATDAAMLLPHAAMLLPPPCVTILWHFPLSSFVHYHRLIVVANVAFFPSPVDCYC